MASSPATTIRLGDKDREVLEKLSKLTGLESHSAIIRLCIRESLAARATAKGKKR